MSYKEKSIYEKIYKDIQKECNDYNISINDFFSYVFEKRSINELRQLKNLCLDELNRLVQKISSFDAANEKNNGIAQNDKIRIHSLSSINQTLPKDITDIISNFKTKSDFEERYFFLITNKSKILGCFGLSIHEEPSPFDRYLYVYIFNLNQQYVTKRNVDYILNYIEALAKKENIYNIDFNNESVGIKNQVLREKGYLQFSGTGIIKINQAVTEPSIRIREDKSKEYSISDIEDYLPIERIRPKSEITNSTEKPKIKKLDFEYENSLETVYIIYLSDTKLASINTFLLLSPVSLYDDILLNNCIVEVIKYLLNSNDRDIIMGLPLDVINNLNIFDYSMVNEVHWYRKVLTYIKK